MPYRLTINGQRKIFPTTKSIQSLLRKLKYKTELGSPIYANDRRILVEVVAKFGIRIKKAEIVSTKLAVDDDGETFEEKWRVFVVGDHILSVTKTILKRNATIGVWIKKRRRTK